MADRPTGRSPACRWAAPQTLNVAFAKLADYGYIGVFSSGVFGIAGGFGGGAPNTAWEDSHKRDARRRRARKDLQLVWFGCGKEDFLLSDRPRRPSRCSRSTSSTSHRETDGGHTWLNWRDYLAEFAPLLFQE